MTSLTVSDLFTPELSGVGPYGTIPSSPASSTWLGRMLTIATTVQLPTTSWQSGAPERTILAIEAVSFAESDVNVSLMAQGAFLQSSATGSVTSTSLNGTTTTTPVTPDPSNASQNPTGALGWEDLLTQSTYDVYRLSATYASGPLALVNLKGSGVGPYLSGSYHVANASTGATYQNPSSLTIPSSVIAGTGGVVTAITPGLTSSILTTQSAHGLTAGEVAYILVPTSAGVSGLAGVFGTVTAVTSNAFSVSVGSSGTYTSGGNVYLCTVVTMQADVIGTAGNAAPGTVTTAITQNAGVFCSNVTAWSGANWESNVALMNRTLLSLASRSPNGPSQAYVYFAETAGQLLAAETPPYVLTNGPVTANASGNPQTGIETLCVASSSPISSVLGAAVTPGCAQNLVSGVSNANPCVVRCVSPTSLSAGQSMTVTISGVLGVSGVDGTFLGTYIDAYSFSIPVNTISAGTYTGGGSVEGGDLGQIDALIQANVTPDNTTSITVSALALPITVVATVVVPVAYVAAYRLAVPTQLEAQIASYSIGGSSASSPAYSVPWDDILSALEEAGVVALGQASYVKGVQSLSVNGLTASGTGVSFPSSQYQAVLITPTITVLGV